MDDVGLRRSEQEQLSGCLNGQVENPGCSGEGPEGLILLPPAKRPPCGNFTGVEPLPHSPY